MSDQERRRWINGNPSNQLVVRLNRAKDSVVLTAESVYSLEEKCGSVSKIYLLILSRDEAEWLQWAIKEALNT